MRVKSGKDVLFLDIDDTIFDTEKHFREVFKSNGLEPDSSCVYRNFDSLAYKIVANNEYINLPFFPVRKGWSESILEELKALFREIYLVTDSFLPIEGIAKVRLAANLGVRIILTTGNKAQIDMQGGTFIDNRFDYLVESNASVKICPSTPFNITREEKQEAKNQGIVVLNTWDEIIQHLRGIEYV